jgi:PAP2 superfamily C-terminal
MTSEDGKAHKLALRPGMFALRVVVTIAAVLLWFGSQMLLGARTAPTSGMDDALHDWTAPANSYLHESPRAADALLIGSSALVDAFGLFLIGSWLFGRSVRPFLGLAILLTIRQLIQALTKLPAPAGMIWHNPSFPTLFVTYHVLSDFFFSGHTAIAVLGAVELARLEKHWLTSLAVLAVFFEIAALIVLRAHYTIDIFAGLITALWAAQISAQMSPVIDRKLAGTSYFPSQKC